MNNQQHYLGGRVWKMSLPKIGLPVPADTPPLKRLMLAQGELAQFYNAPEGIRFIAWIELIPGMPRGNHFHKEKHEYIYVLDGETDVAVAELNGTAREILHLAPGDLAFLPPHLAHALNPISPGGAIEFSPQLFNPSDIYPCKV